MDNQKPMDAQKIEKLVAKFQENLSNSNNSVGVAVIKTLTNAIEESTADTFMGVDIQISDVIKAIKMAYPKLPIHFYGAAQVFRAGMSKASDTHSKGNWKALFIEHARQTALEAEKVLRLIPQVSTEFLQHGMTILTNGYDQMVQSALKVAASDGRNFHVVITEGRPRDDGVKMALSLKHPNLKVTVIPDSAVGLWMSKAHVVLVGTDLVLEDGGLLAPVGTSNLCTLAYTHRKPVYCLCETFKFMRKYIIGTDDIQEYQRQCDYKPTGAGNESLQDIEIDAPEFDFTPAKFITLLLTEKGPMPPSAVTHELTKLLGVS
ncbi:translation initiation factor eIF-2B subunit alpha-like [Histomonas meleagridis]|uniref:translation initiation factor eIF-2B subunit alpha-like n=1 Tax=Histomonas meleagridis TaxID=135588 RepID=UPI0035597D9A|nr:translation initiation factor eIF-2B subunit alpha-like [Histomonas meleagridis]KAH0798857.1 translation initiation factor eIF-2B subunit alpha-like [Histomonas meleagridis]